MTSSLALTPAGGSGCGGKVTKLTHGYRYQPWRALWFLAAVVTFSCVLVVVQGAHGALAQAAGIEPFATLYHWDLPQALHEKYGGWQSKDTAKAFADYAGYIAEQLSDRVKHCFTINEFASFVEGGYQGLDVKVGGGKIVHLGVAPGLKLSDSDLKQVRHHAVLGHGLAVQAIRSQAPTGAKVGFAENIRVAIPAISAPTYVAAAENATRERNAGFMTVMLEGRYTDEYLAEAGGESPTFTADELNTIAEPLDFVGINVYKPGWYVEPTDEPPGWPRGGA